MKVLFVDDEKFFLTLYRDFLEGESDWEGEFFERADDALRRFDQGGVDMVVTDLVMPGTDGLALIAALRERDPDVPIVVVSQLEDVGPAVSALRLGVNEYIVKPVDKDLLLISLERAAKNTGLRRENRRLRAQQTEAFQSDELYRACLDVVANSELVHLQDAFLDHLVRLTGAQGAALWHGGPSNQEPFELRAYSGLATPDTLPDVYEVEPGTVGADRLTSNAAWIEDSRALFVPLVNGATLIGVAMVADKLAGAFTAADASRARTLGDFAAVAFQNAHRFTALQRAGLRDRETAAYNLTYFIDYAGKEIYKARRYGRSFALVSIQVDNLDVLKRALSPETTRTVHKALIAAVRAVIRDADILAKVTEDTFYLLLPETDYFGAIMFARRMLAGFNEDPGVKRLTVPPAIALGSASFPSDGHDFDELIVACRRRQDEVRRSPYRRLHLEEQPFWDLLDTLLETPAKSVTVGRSGRRGPVQPAVLDLIMHEAALKLQREHQARGLVYYGADTVDLDLPLLDALDPGRTTASRVYILGRQVPDVLDHPNVTTVQFPDEDKFGSRRFFLYLTEHAQYAWMHGDDEVYHTSDPVLVEGLVARLQDAYDLQQHY